MRGVPALGVAEDHELGIGHFHDTEAPNNESSFALEGGDGRERSGIVSKPSSHSVDQAVDKLKDMLKAKDVTLFAVIDSECPSQFHPMLMQYPGNS